MIGNPSITTEVIHSIREIAEMGDLNDDPATLCKPEENSKYLSNIKGTGGTW